MGMPELSPSPEHCSCNSGLCQPSEGTFEGDMDYSCVHGCSRGEGDFTASLRRYITARAVQVAVDLMAFEERARDSEPYDLESAHPLVGVSALVRATRLMSSSGELELALEGAAMRDLPRVLVSCKA